MQLQEGIPLRTDARLARFLPWDYPAAAALFLAGYSALLFLLVDVLRGVLGASTMHHLGLAALSLLAMAVGYLHMRRLEARLGPVLDAHAATRWMAGAMVLVPFAALLVYRVVGGARSAAAGAIRLRETWSLAEAPVWLKPFVAAANYAAETWFATLVGLLIAAGVLAFLPSLLRSGLGRDDWRSHLLATMFALPNMFCSCCASPIAGALYRGGAALRPTLAFAVAAPSLNLVTLLLAVLLLPSELATVRLLAGVLIALPLASLAAGLSGRWPRSHPIARPLLPEDASRWWQKPLVLLSRLVADACQLELVGDRPAPRSPADVVAQQARLSWRIGRLVVPLLLLGYLVAGTCSALLAGGSGLGQGVWSVLVAAALGTLVMIPTAVELPTALALSAAGYPAVAAVLLVVLPPVSLPALLVIGGSLGSYRPVAVLAGLVCLLGVATGLAFLWLG